ncbi:hypothetical protein [Baaleninema simplex]|uniref:hypothetical protein n=1 Tax=Baaleninema simplex TaxID=2862350 RepID=UPI0003468E36|nr:hypothetical protein [Baaleninema simplex]
MAPIARDRIKTAVERVATVAIAALLSISEAVWLPHRAFASDDTAGGTEIPRQIDEWQELENQGAGFAVAMPPGTVRQGVQPVETSLGDLDVYILGVDLDDRAFAVMVADFPSFFAAVPPSTLFEGAIAGVATNVDRRLTPDRRISLSGYPGMELFYEGGDGLVYKHQLYLVDRRLYQLMAAIPLDIPEAERNAFFEKARPFFESFEFLDRPL